MANEVQIFEMIGGRGDDAAPVSFLAKQTLSIDGAASAAFNRSASQIRVISTTGCVIEFGSAPDGLGTTYPIVAGHMYDFSVVAGQKVIAVAGTATAPSVTATVSTAGLATEAKQDTQITAEQGSATSLAIIDDWDESDRAKVNIVAGQAGITAGAGAVGASTPRVTLASDDPLVASLKSATGTKSAVVSGIASVTILASNASRKGATIANTDANALYLDLSGGTASSTSFSVKIAADGYFEVPFGYTGAITGIWAADGSGSALVTEFA